jgi:hypothetical protein
LPPPKAAVLPAPPSNTGRPASRWFGPDTDDEGDSSASDSEALASTVDLSMFAAQPPLVKKVGRLVG